MADKFSIDDIISEYSEKVENDLKSHRKPMKFSMKILILMRVPKKIMIPAI